MKKANLEIPPHSERELSKEAQLAVAAADRAGKKLRERKRALGQMLVVWKNGNVVFIKP